MVVQGYMHRRQIRLMGLQVLGIVEERELAVVR